MRLGGVIAVGAPSAWNGRAGESRVVAYLTPSVALETGRKLVGKTFALVSSVAAVGTGVEIDPASGLGHV